MIPPRRSLALIRAFISGVRIDDLEAILGRSFEGGDQLSSVESA